MECHILSGSHRAKSNAERFFLRCRKCICLSAPNSIYEKLAPVVSKGSSIDLSRMASGFAGDGCDKAVGHGTPRELLGIQFIAVR